MYFFSFTTLSFTFFSFSRNICNSEGDRVEHSSSNGGNFVMDTVIFVVRGGAAGFLLGLARGLVDITRLAISVDDIGSKISGLGAGSDFRVASGDSASGAGDLAVLFDFFLSAPVEAGVLFRLFSAISRQLSRQCV